MTPEVCLLHGKRVAGVGGDSEFADLTNAARERFAARQDRETTPDGCWPWTGSMSNGYGSFSLGGRSVRAHRLAWFLAHGPIPAGLAIGHLCNRKACTRPDHLQPMTYLQNVHDAIRDGLVPSVDRGFAYLAESCAARDPRAWRALDRVARRICKWATHGTTSPVDPDDVRHDVYERLLANDCEAIRPFVGQPNRNLCAFIISTARNRVTDLWRRRAVRAVRIVEPVEFAEADAERSALVAQLHEIAPSHGQRGHRERDAEVFSLYYRDGMTATEIGERLGIKMKTAETIIFRITASVRDAVREAA